MAKFLFNKQTYITIKYKCSGLILEIGYENTNPTVIISLTKREKLEKFLFEVSYTQINIRKPGCGTKSVSVLR
jgi:hypothetical protein